MRFLHTSDWHLGRTLHRDDLTDAHAAYLDHLVELARAERVDAVLVSGDIYDRPIAPLASVELLDDTLVRLSELTNVVLTSGNHDSATRLGFGARLWRDRVHVRSQATAAGEPVLIPDAEGGVTGRVFCLPYLDPDMVRGPLGAVTEDGTVVPVARSHEAVVGAAMDRVARALAASGPAPTVVMAHAFVAGGQASESEREIKVGGVDVVPAGALVREGVDYVALGHLHGPQDVRSPLPMRYSGSPIAFSFSEKDHVKGTLLVELGANGVVHEERVAAPVHRRLTELRGDLEQVLSGAFEASRGDYVKVTVTDQVRPEHLFARVKEHFPHALVVLHEPPERVQPTGVPVIRAAEDACAVLAEFVEQVRSAPPTDEEAEILAEAWEAAATEEVSA